MHRAEEALQQRRAGVRQGKPVCGQTARQRQPSGPGLSLGLVPIGSRGHCSATDRHRKPLCMHEQLTANTDHRIITPAP